MIGSKYSGFSSSVAGFRASSLLASGAVFLPLMKQKQGCSYWPIERGTGIRRTCVEAVQSEQHRENELENQDDEQRVDGDVVGQVVDVGHVQRGEVGLCPQKGVFDDFQVDVRRQNGQNEHHGAVVLNGAQNRRGEVQSEEYDDAGDDGLFGLHEEAGNEKADVDVAEGPQQKHEKYHEKSDVLQNDELDQQRDDQHDDETLEVKEGDRRPEVHVLLHAHVLHVLQHQRLPVGDHLPDDPHQRENQYENNQQTDDHGHDVVERARVVGLHLEPVQAHL